MLTKGVFCGRRVIMFLIVVFLAVSVMAVTVNVRTYVEGGAKNNAVSSVRSSWGDPADTYNFANCDSSIGEYVAGYKLVRTVDAESVNAEVICESIGENNTFTVNTIFSTEINGTPCTSGEGIMKNIAVSDFAADVTFSCTGTTGCGGGTTGCGYETNFPKNCVDFTNEDDCKDTEDDCEWDDDEDECVVGDSSVYDPDCTGKNRQGQCEASQGCYWGKDDCSIYDNDESICRHPFSGCSWDGHINCTTFGQIACQDNDFNDGDCYWTPSGGSGDSQFGTEANCPDSSPIMIGVAGYNGEGAAYCRDDMDSVVTTETSSSLYNDDIIGILPRCASLDNPNCNYRFPGTGCFWYLDKEDGGCPANHYVNGVRGLVGDASITYPGKDIYVESYCCTIEPIDHTKEDGAAATDGQDNDCDGFIDEGYFSPDFVTDIESDYCSIAQLCDGTIYYPDNALYCSFSNVNSANTDYCQLEGTYYLDGDIEGACNGTTVADEPLELFTIDYDIDQAACNCKFGANAWAGSIDGWGTFTTGNETCCEDGTDDAGEKEFFVDSFEGTVSCCNNLIDANGDRTVSIEGECLQTKSYWIDTEDTEIVSTDYKDSLHMKIENVNIAPDTEVLFEIWERDGLGNDDDPIRTVAEGTAIKGVVDSNHNLIADWTITPRDMSLTLDYGDFYFKVNYSDIGDNIGSGYKESPPLDVSTDYNDSLMEVTIVQPACGENFSVGDNVTIYIEAEEKDDFMNGTITINQKFVRSFTNGDTIFNHTFDIPGNYQIVADAVNNRNKRARHIANIMIIDTNVVGAKYVAACITEPKDFIDIDESIVPFDASATRAIEIKTGGAVDVTNPGSTRLSWYWTFYPQEIVREFVKSSDSKAYLFTAKFPIAGGNSASLRVEFE